MFFENRYISATVSKIRLTEQIVAAFPDEIYPVGQLYGFAGRSPAGLLQVLGGAFETMLVGVRLFYSFEPAEFVFKLQPDIKRDLEMNFAVTAVHKLPFDAAKTFVPDDPDYLQNSCARRKRSSVCKDHFSADFFTIGGESVFSVRGGLSLNFFHAAESVTGWSRHFVFRSYLPQEEE